MPNKPHAGLLGLAMSLTTFLACAGANAAGQIYTWKDANGVTHYSDLQPGTDKVKVLQAGSQREVPRPAPESAATEASSAEASPAKADATPVDPETAFRKRRAEAAEAQAKTEKERRETQDRKERCDDARNLMAGLRRGDRVARFNADGEKVVLDDAAREAEIASTQQMLNKDCK